eukprot:gene1319-2541_t
MFLYIQVFPDTPHLSGASAFPFPVWLLISITTIILPHVLTRRRIICFLWLAADIKYDPKIRMSTAISLTQQKRFRNFVFEMEIEMLLELRNSTCRAMPYEDEKTQDVLEMPAKDKDQRRVKRWHIFAKAKMAFGFEKLPPIDRPLMSAKVRGFSIQFEKILGWTMPLQLLEEVEVGGFQMSAQLSLSLFHLKTKTFFGTTWMGTSVPIADGDTEPIVDVLDIDYREITYMISKLADPQCVAVVELVVSKLDGNKQLTASQYGCGWTVIPLFDEPEPSDVSDGQENCPSQTFTMYAGSPRLLLLYNDKQLEKNLKELAGCKLQIKLYLNKKLLRAQRLISENEIIGSPRKIACIGEAEIHRDRRGIIYEPARPSVRPPMTLKVIDWQLQIPDRLKMETRMRISVAKSVSVIETTNALVLSRTLKIGLHNGHTVIGGDWQLYSMEPDPDDPDVLVLPEQIVEVHGYVPHDLMALCLVIEYEIGLPISKETNFNIKNTLQTTIIHDRLVSTVTLGAAIFVPFDGTCLYLRNVDLDNDGDGDADGRLGMELGLNTDDSSSVLSPHVLYKDTIPKPKDKNITKNDRNNKDKDDETKEETSAVVDQYLLPRMGFDLQCVHSTKGDIEHGENLLELEEEEGMDDREMSSQPHKKTPSTTRRDMDAVSVSDSIVEGDSVASTLRLEQSYYTTVGRDREREPSELSDRDMSEGSDRRYSSSMPRDPNSLLGRSMTARLHTRGRSPGHAVSDGMLDDEGPLFVATGRRPPSGWGEDTGRMRETISDRTMMRETGRMRQSFQESDIHRASRTIAPPVPRRKTAATMGIAPYIRELSRAARARLGRHGFTSAIQDSAGPSGDSRIGGGAKATYHYQSDALGFRDDIVDVDLEAQDSLSMHDISVQFAGYRVGPAPKADGVGGNHPQHPPAAASRGPQSVYFTFQFYTCTPTKTEIMRLLPADAGEVCVLARDETSVREEAPLALRYIIDTTVVSPNEAIEFSEYLSKITLFIDVWDANSLLLIGVCGIPLRRLMRQGNSTTKCAIECDIIDPESLMEMYNGISTTVLSEGGPIVGDVVGALQVIMCNYGQKGKGNLIKTASCGISNAPRPIDADRQGLNWRAMGADSSAVDKNDTGNDKHHHHRPKNSVRARPLAEGAPDLSRALNEHRQRMSSDVPSLRSMMSLRGAEGFHTLTYDEVVTLFRRFQGGLKGTVQYMGSLLKLLDVPSFSISIRKLLKAFGRALDAQGSIGAIDKGMRSFCNAEGEMSMNNLKEYFRLLTVRQGVNCKPEEIQILAQKFISDDKDVTLPRTVIDFLSDELKREQWLKAGKRLRRAIQRATLAGIDPEQLLSDRDSDGDHYISGRDFKYFIMEVSKYSKLSQQEANLIVTHFSRRSNRGEDRDVISLREVMSFLGGQYVGNLQVRMARALTGESGNGNVSRTPQQILHTLKQHYAEGLERHSTAKNAEFEWLETGLGYLGVFEDLSHDQVRKVLSNAKRTRGDRLAPGDLLRFIGINVPMEASTTQPKHMTVESLLRMLLERTSQMGLAVDNIFRQFDANGDGTITVSELVDGLSKLKIFDSVPNWKSHIPELVKKFDKDGDGNVSLKEFFKFLGVDYAPNVLQYMTKIFAVAVERGGTVQEIYEELDDNGDGGMSAEELLAKLQAMGTFPEVTLQDAKDVIAQFDTDGDGQVSMEEFVGFFSDRVKQAQAERMHRKVAQKFRDMLRAALAKGLKMDQIFAHFDKDGGGSISTEELTAGLKKMPHFKSMSSSEIQGLVQMIDADGSNDISLNEFRAFLDLNAGIGQTQSQNSLVLKLQTVFRTAADKGLSVDQIFAHFDKDGGGSVSTDELATGLKKMPHFKELTHADIQGLVRILDADGSGDISLQEFRALVDSESSQSPENVLVRRLRTVIQSAEKKGLSIDQIFAHFDKDGGGSVTTDELAAGLKKMPHFKELTNADIRGIVDILDADGSGDISLQEFRELVTPHHPKSVGIASIAQRLQSVLKNAEKKGLTLDQIFAHFDKDGDGCLSSSELFSGLRSLPHFSGLSVSEARNVVQLLDSDDSGEVSLEEFKSFIRNGTITRVDKVASKKMANIPKDELFARHMRRISEPDGGIQGFIAFLDNDEDGIISKDRLFRILGREGVFESLFESDVEALIAPLMKGTKDGISAIGLLRLLEGVEGTKDDKDKSDEEDEIQMEPEYEFSNDMETRALEKKLRGVGRVLAKRGMDVEGLFKSYDVRDSGCVRRTEFVEALSRMGLYLLEKGKVIEASDGDEEGELRRMQMRQISRLRGSYAENASRAARRFVMAAGDDRARTSDFKEHLESMALVGWYRQSQKRMLLQRVLSHSLASTVRIYPRFGKTLFFEHPVTNPFGHEERFQIEVADPELRLVTSLGEWLHLRQLNRPCVGELGLEPVEAEVFDRDGYGNVQVALLPHETFHIPFTFLSLIPHMPLDRIAPQKKSTDLGKAEAKGYRDRGGDAKGVVVSKGFVAKNDEGFHVVDESEEPHRVVEIKVISATHGHVIAVIKVEICPRSFVLQRVMRFYEAENSIMKRRIQLLGYDNVADFVPGESIASTKYVHCVETNVGTKGVDSRVVVEWGPTAGPGDANAMDILLRYRCPSFPGGGDFFLLIYDDPYQAKLHEIWHVVVQTRQRLDLHSTVGTSVAMDLVVRGDRFARRARAYASSASEGSLVVNFEPESVFHLVSGAFNRVVMTVSPKKTGTRRCQINIVDVDSRELISSWLANCHATAPVVLREYEVNLQVGKAMHKKIVFKNPWDIPRRFVVSSSDESVMRHRTPNLVAAPQGTAYLRLWFAGASPGQGPKQVYLFLNDEKGQNEECFLFILKESEGFADGLVEDSRWNQHATIY